MGNLELLQTSIHDHRKFAVWRILGPKRYTTDVAVYEDDTGGLHRVRGRDSDFFILLQRCLS